METFETIQKVVDGKILIDLPEEFNNKDEKVAIAAESEFGDEEDHDDLNDDELKRFHELSGEERLRILQQFAGSAKYPDFPINKYDVYDQ